MLLSAAYEEYLAKAGLTSSVIGYRAGLGSNINLAMDAFAEIHERGDCTTLSFDLKDFFDTIEHRALKANLKKVLGVSSLPENWYAVFKAMTAYGYVTEDELRTSLGLDSNQDPRPICSIEDFRLLRKTHSSLIQTNTAGVGIPQGSPISAVFSNVAMLDFDIEMHSAASIRSASYRRYSDDILLICKPDDASFIESHLIGMLAAKTHTLELNVKKSEKSEFRSVSVAKQRVDKPLTYLGFTFDGAKVSLRGRTLSRYYRRMTYATRHTAVAASKNATSKKPYKRSLYKQFSHLGKASFYAYAKRASHIMNDGTPIRQLRRHFKILNRKLCNRGR